MARISSQNLAGLSVREKRFVKAYIGEAMGRAVDAVYLAGYEPSSRQVAYVMSYRLLRKAAVREAIDGYLEREVASGAQILKAFSDIFMRAHLIDAECMVDEEGEVEGPDGQPIRVKTGRRLFDREQASRLGLSPLVKRVTRTKHGDVVETYDRSEAGRLLANYRGLLSEKIRVESTEDLSKLSADDLRRIAEGSTN